MNYEISRENYWNLVKMQHFVCIFYLWFSIAVNHVIYMVYGEFYNLEEQNIGLKFAQKIRTRRLGSRSSGSYKNKKSVYNLQLCKVTGIIRFYIASHKATSRSYSIRRLLVRRISVRSN